MVIPGVFLHLFCCSSYIEKGTRGGKDKNKYEIKIVWEKNKAKFSFPGFFIPDNITKIFLR